MFKSSTPSSVVSHKHNKHKTTHIHPTQLRQALLTIKEQTKSIIYAKGDSAASHPYWREEDKMVLDDIEPHSGPSILLPNNSTISVTSQRQLPLSESLSSQAKNSMILPDLK